MPNDPSWDETTAIAEPTWEETSPIEAAEEPAKPKVSPVPAYPVDPRFGQAALGGMGAVPYQITPEHQGVMEPALQLPRWYPKSTAAKIIAAPVNVAEGLVESTTVPAFAPLLAGGPILSKAGALVGPSAGVLSKIAPVVEKAVPKVLGLGFGVPAAYEGAKQIYEGKGDLQPTLEGALNVGVGGLMAGAPFASQRPGPIQGPLATGEILRTPEGAKPPPQTEIVIQAEPPEAKVEAKPEAVAEPAPAAPEPAKSPLSEPGKAEASTPSRAAVAGEEGQPGTVTAAPGTASQKAAISEAKPETGGLQEAETVPVPAQATPAWSATKAIPALESRIGELHNFLINSDAFGNSEFYDRSFPIPREGGIISAKHTQRYRVDPRYAAKVDTAIKDITDTMVRANRQRLALMEKPDTGSFGVDYSIGKARATYGVNVVRAWHNEAKQKYPYTHRLGNVSVREAFQNSLDAVLGALQARQIKQGTIKINTDSFDNKGFSVDDNGIGMSDTDIGQKFLSLHSTGKAVEGRFGGFGIAKAVILGPADSGTWTLDTRDNHFTHEMAQGNEMVGSIPRRQGTKIEVVTQDYIIDEDARRYVESTELPKNVTVEYNGQPLASPFKRLKPQREHVEVNDQTSYDMSYYPHAPEGGYNQKYIIRLVDEKTGAKLTQAIKDVGNDGFNGTIVVDVKTSAVPGSEGYPLVDSRMDLKWGAEKPVNKLIEKHSIDPLSARRVGTEYTFRRTADRPEWRDTVSKIDADPEYQKLVSEINKVWEETGKFFGTTPDRPFTPLADLDIKIDKGHKGYKGGTMFQAKQLAAFEAVSRLMAHDAGAQVTRFYGLLSKPVDGTSVNAEHAAGGVMGLNFINADKTLLKSPASYALWLRDLVSHELTHDFFGPHNEEFSATLGAIQKKTAHLFPYILRIAEAALGKEADFGKKIVVKRVEVPVEKRIEIPVEKRILVEKYLSPEQLQFIYDNHEKQATGSGKDELYYPNTPDAPSLFQPKPGGTDYGRPGFGGTPESPGTGGIPKQPGPPSPVSPKSGGVGPGGMGAEQKRQATPAVTPPTTEPIGGEPGPGAQGSLATPPIAPTGGAVAPANVPVKAISQIIRDLSKGLNVPVRFGRLTTTKFAGYFKAIPNLIGSKKANDLPVVSHEIGHKLDTTLKISSDPALAAELDLLGDPARLGPGSSWTPGKPRAYKMGEGVAEFVRQWIDDPVAVARAAPNLSRYFEDLMNTQLDLGRVLRQAQEDVRLWKTAPALARLDSSIVKGQGPVKARYTISNLTRDLVDDLHFLRLASEEAGGGRDLPASRNPYVLARLLRGTFGMADTFAQKGIVDFATKAVRPGTGLEQILKPVSGRLNDFRRFIVAKRAKELQGQGRETGLVPSDVDEAIRTYQGEPEFQATFDKLKAWNDSLLQYAQDAGMLTKETVAAMRTMNQDYVPFHRLFEIGANELSAESGLGTGRGLNAGTPGSLKRLKGSPRDIVDPLETMIRNAYAIVTASEKNAISVALSDLARLPNMGKWVERIRTPIDPHKVTMGDLRKRLEGMGADVSMIPDDSEFAFFRKSGRTPYGENIIKVVKNGKSEYFRINGDLYETFQALDYDLGSRFIRYFSAPSQVLRAGVTLNPDFALSNIIRDTVSSAVISRYGTLPFYHTLRGIIHLLGLGDKKVVAEWMASGGKQAVEATYFDAGKIQKFLKEKITKNLTPVEQAIFYAKSPLLALRMFTGLLEEGTRVGQFELVYKKLRAQGVPEGDARRMAAYEARDLQDFAKGGANTKSLRMMTAFWNAGLQANVRLAQAFKEHPIQTTLRGMAYITLPKLLEQAVNWNDDDYWDRPQWERDLFFLFPYSKDANGKTKFLRIPTPFEVGLIFGTVPGRFLQSIRERDPEAAKTLFYQGGLAPGMAFTQVIPNPIPQWLMTLLETAMGKQGYSIWRQRPIVPTSLADEATELQFTDQTSLTSRKAGKMLGLSPAKVDYALQGTTGGLGRLAVHQGLDRVIAAMTGEKRTAENVTPGGRFVTIPAGIQSAAVDKFYAALDSARQDVSRFKAKQPTVGDFRTAAQLEKINRQIGEIRAVIRKIPDPVKRQKYQLEIVRLAKLGAQYHDRITNRK